MKRCPPPWQRADLPDRQRVAGLLRDASSRADFKRWGDWLDGDGVDLKPAVLLEARRHEPDLPEDALNWPGKRLLRLAKGRESEARTRLNPVRRDETFTCAWCGREVPVGGRVVRDHCPRCLRSVHVDVAPGDRASTCQGILEPVGAEVVARVGVVILYRCVRCGASHRNRASLDGEVIDDPVALRRLVAGEGAPEAPWVDAP